MFSVDVLMRCWMMLGVFRLWPGGGLQGRRGGMGGRSSRRGEGFGEGLRLIGAIGARFILFVCFGDVGRVCLVMIVDWD